MDEVSFISQNKNDFYDLGKPSQPNDEPKFFAALRDEINALKISASFKAYLTLGSYITQNVPADEHEFTYQEFEEKFINPIESDIEKEIEFAINSLTPLELERKIDNWHHNYAIRGIIESYKFIVIEGMEDIDVSKVNKLPGGGYYVNLSFTLRRCEFIFALSSENYFGNKTLIDKNYDDVEIGTEETLAYLYFRPHFEVTLKISEDIVFEAVVDRVKLN
jgi:hypothetical protein